MGLTVGTVKLFCELQSTFEFKGNLLTLGKQNIILTAKQWQEVRDQTVVKLKDIPLSVERHVRWKNDLITAKYFFKSLGFEEVSAIDVSSYENAEFIFDMNEPQLPEYLQNRFDFICDGSTIEHIFHLPNVLANIHKMLKIGGSIMHISPANNFVEDGFYQLSPTFYFDYYTANNYQVDFIKLRTTKFERQSHGEGEILLTEDTFIDYNADAVADIRFTPYGSDFLETVCLVTKMENSLSEVIPTQRRYASKGYWSSNLERKA